MWSRDHLHVAGGAVLVQAMLVHALAGVVDERWATSFTDACRNEPKVDPVFRD